MSGQHKAMTALHVFDDKLKYHDWDYEHADDYRAWSAGHSERASLRQIATQSDDHALLYATWSGFVSRRLTTEQRDEVRRRLGLMQQPEENVR